MEEQAARLLEASQAQTREQLLQRIQQGQEAEILLGSKVLEAWFKDSQDNLLDIVDEIPLSDTVSRDRVYTLITLFRKLRASLESYVETGKTSKEDLSKYLELEKKGLLGRIFDV